MPERSEGVTKGLRVINFVVPCVLKSNYFSRAGGSGRAARAIALPHFELNCHVTWIYLHYNIRNCGLPSVNHYLY